MTLKLPGNKKFIFTIIDDTDDAFTEKIKPVYDILHENGLKTTKTVWVNPVRDHDRSKGDSLADQDYRSFVLDIQKKGFEIALHNVGSGSYKRDEIINGIEKYKNILGNYPKLHVNHSYNPDNIYCGSKRFSFPFNWIVKKMYSQYNSFYGEVKGSIYFWGDLHKKHIKYSRNYEIDDINTYKINPYMPYRDKKYDEFCNYWYSSTFASNQWMFNRMVNKKSIDKLEEEGGICILYTHLGYFYKNGEVDKGFKSIVEYLGSKENGLYIPVGEVMKLLKKNKMSEKKDSYIPYWQKKKLEFLSLKTRIKYRFFIKKDDYHFKKSKIYQK
tara:strand:+ start:16986 stop:17969 length:984 start_codon:yes stop_codon:yes gene_type:complete